VWVFVTSQRVAMCVFCAEVMTFVGFLPAAGGVMACGYLGGCQRLCWKI
jgi:hypothetical protein